MAAERESFSNTIIVVVGPDEAEVEINGNDVMGSLDEEASLSIKIGSAVRKMLLSAHDGDPVTVMAYSR